MIVSLTGVTGNMGYEAIKEVLTLNSVEKVKALVFPTDKRVKKIRMLGSRVEIILGSLADMDVCENLVKDADYVVNMAAVIPPMSDQYPSRAVACNEVGVKNLIAAIERQSVQPRFIHISTVALYGNRTHVHPWARIGDPLLISPFDIYTITKMRGEFAVLESNIDRFVVLRQTACLYDGLIFSNLSDGLLFHTCFNSPLEWITVHDSGVLIKNIIERDSTLADLDDKFWRKCFNIGGGDKNRITGYDTFNEGLKLVGGKTKDLFEPSFNAIRNFHGVWFYDGQELEELFHYQSETVEEYWKQLFKKYRVMKIARIFPKKLIKKIAIMRLFKDPNSVRYWYNNNDEARLLAYFGGKSNYERLMQIGWDYFPLLVENKDQNGNFIDFAALKDPKNASLTPHFYDESKPIDIEALRSVARAHGGRLLSKKFVSLYDKLKWQNSDGDTFIARPYTVLFGGHWFNPSYKNNVWDFDRLAKVDKVYASLWYDSHSPEENHFYSCDTNFNACVAIVPHRLRCGPSLRT